MLIFRSCVEISNALPSTSLSSHVYLKNLSIFSKLLILLDLNVKVAEHFYYLFALYIFLIFFLRMSFLVLLSLLHHVHTPQYLLILIVIVEGVVVCDLSRAVMTPRMFKLVNNLLNSQTLAVRTDSPAKLEVAKENKPLHRNFIAVTNDFWP